MPGRLSGKPGGATRDGRNAFGRFDRNGSKGRNVARRSERSEKRHCRSFRVSAVKRTGMEEVLSGSSTGTGEAKSAARRSEPSKTRAGRYLAHSIGWKRGPLGPHILEQTRVRKWGRAALGPSSSSRTGRLPPSGGRSGVGRRRGDHRGTHRLLASAAWIQVEFKGKMKVTCRNNILIVERLLRYYALQTGIS
jgi:hypothetical protein